MNLRDDVFRKKKCDVSVNVSIIEQTRMFTVKKKGVHEIDHELRSAV